MVKDVKRTLTIPEGTTVSVNEGFVTVSGPKGQLERNLAYPAITIEQSGNEVFVDATNVRKKSKAMVGTTFSHINNMVTGVNDGYEYKLKIVYSHFPMQVKVEKDALNIGNFLGEKSSRIARIFDGVTVKTSGDEVTVSGTNKESVGQTAANIEQATKIKRFDPRVFQDGIYVIAKGSIGGV